MTPVAGPSPTDIRPIIPRNNTNLWTQAETLRDELFAHFAEACRADNLEPLLLQSGPYVFPAWVKFEAWQPQGDRSTTRRSSTTVTIEPKPYHATPFEFDITYTVGVRTRRFPRVLPLNGKEVAVLVGHLTQNAPKPSFRRFREVFFQLWRPANKIQGLGVDGLAIATTLGFLAGMFLLSAVPPLGILLWIGAGAAWWARRGRPWIVRIDGKPEGEPRSLIRVDSWQTVLLGLGGDLVMVRERLLNEFKAGLGAQVRFQPERVWYWGLDGKEEREQFVLTAGRGILFSQIYAYGRDLYVGWDGHLNRGQWVEQTVASGIDRSSGNPITITRVIPGTQPATEYDLVDLSCLMEWTHAQVVKVLKQLVAERKIDQELDFSIQRAERQRVAESASADDGGVANKVRKVFRRTA